MIDPSSAGSNMLTRDCPIVAGKTALLVIDVQYYIAAAGYGEYAHIDPNNIDDDLVYFFDRIDNNIVKNTATIQKACRLKGIEVLFTVVENMTLDGRDRSLDYKISKFSVPKGTKGAKVLTPIAPVGDEMVFPKTTSSVFNSTTIDYVLRNMGIEHLIVTGMLTDQCVESSVRDACDKGYIVKVVEDACGTYSQQRHDSSLALYKGYCHISSTEGILDYIEKA